jgi:hypothetical protein
MDYTMSPQHLLDPYHFQFVQVALARDLGLRVADILDEITAVFSELTSPTDGKNV